MHLATSTLLGCWGCFPRSRGPPKRTKGRCNTRQEAWTRAANVSFRDHADFEMLVYVTAVPGKTLEVLASGEDEGGREDGENTKKSLVSLFPTA